MSKAGVDQELIRQLAALLTETDLSEIEIETDNLKLRVARQVSAAVAHVAPAAAPAAAPASAPAAVPTAAEAASHPGAVTSPMVGTAYLSPEPGAPTFVQPGTNVSEGQTILIIEAMKTMNHIPAPRSGKLTAVLVDDGQPVEFGEPLFVIE
ncbi:acetyl-CoA carboxylase biotin carboxyl carrier protein [Parvibaculum sp.]|uniref:acetyl-CoA carboxylase biotin carboxyl carrier protein n=1 Tax=Parvibaculum sp. TaxID=2024848 RepID=UPI001B2662D6|nr:acetyl-CoA carboxylase biotin carboxyl carrier protein [Parvibaculum sp.]MBO6635292.1 acetyl-CoA carboxylase biotin carboxyl carrier protein [Parvibaculum sp.]MBO6678963.1 acetyl-CoA carboxylase biotin carboxyl carrier protein [Parvibaculum sp.]MBO6685812.1 acetyl-CoA carboxylase biotin carboxyl carrier protein [Parvibaculum sp.]MBO6903726.1 acetyl-CoA carboxylase biotin carboxyl carrier protein [Parvibaculum sp.]